MRLNHSLFTTLAILAVSFSSISYALQPPKPEHCPTVVELGQADVLSIDVKQAHWLTTAYVITKYNPSENWGFRFVDEFGSAWSYSQIENFEKGDWTSALVSLASGPTWVPLNGNDGAWVCKYKGNSGALAYATIPMNITLLSSFIK